MIKDQNILNLIKYHMLFYKWIIYGKIRYFGRIFIDRNLVILFE